MRDMLCCWILALAMLSSPAEVGARSITDLDPVLNGANQAWAAESDLFTEADVQRSRGSLEQSPVTAVATTPPADSAANDPATSPSWALTDFPLGEEAAMAVVLGGLAAMLKRRKSPSRAPRPR
jgi:hypothetical protein